MTTVAYYWGIFLLCTVLHLVRTLHVEKCNLQSSELGPDWYKVTRPIPTGLEGDPDYQNSYVHMPCAETTVFDVAVCGCTNLMSFIYTSVAGRRKPGQHHHPDVKIEHRQLDLVRTRDPVKPKSQSKKRLGTRLLNIRTGEVRHCPFRSSSRGPEWYLVHEPTETWRPMRCAPGTLFQKRSCTCVHRDLISNDPEKPEDRDIVVLEEEYDNHGKHNTISESLGISVSDVDFSRKAIDESIPFWRRHSAPNVDTPAHTSNNVDKSAVFVTLNGEITNFDTHNRLHDFNMGKDTIADEHRALLKRLRKGPIANLGTERIHSPMFLDLASKNPTNTAITMDTRVKEFLTPDMASTIDKKPFRLKLDSKRDEKLQDINNAIMFLGKHKSKGSNANTRNGINNIRNTMTKGKTMSNLLPVKDEVYFVDRECPKKPLPELGPQYFKLYMWGVGHIPYTCHGNLIYDDTVCACVPVPVDSTINEVNIPVQVECDKRAVPELGPEYFTVHMWMVGAVPYACHGDRVFDQSRCACVSRQRMRI